MSPRLADHLLVVVIAVVVPIVGTITYRHLLEALAAAEPGIRLRQYWQTIALEWGLAGAALGIWWWGARPWAALGMAVPGGWRLAAGLGITALAAAALGLQWRAIRRLDSAGLAKIAAQFGEAAGLMPADDREHRVFRLLAISAGICEEVFARGFLIWYFGVWVGPWPAMIAAAVIFGIGHWYQGPAGVAKTAVAGLVAGTLYLVSGSLLWPMILHAGVDLQGGAVGRLVARARPA